MPDHVELLASYWTMAGDIDARGDAVSPWPFEERVAQAAAAGYVGFGLTHAELCCLDSTMGLRRVRSVFDDHGISIVELEVLTDWFASGAARVRSDAVRRDLLRGAELLGVRHVKVHGTLSDADEDVGVQRMIESFSELCVDAADAGTAIVIEMLPVGNVNTLEKAVRIVEDCGVGNGGLLLDMWHVARTATPLDAVAALPLGCLMHVELDDGGPPAPGSAFDDALRNRKLCGEGEFDVAGLCRATTAAGYHGPYGIEILSTSFRKLPLAEMARRSFDTAAAVIDRAG
jgi:sugar phosphate isomerase/epimerase